MVGLPHFSLLRVIGRGSFGKVRIVERRDTKKLYALKYISKVDCVKMGGLKNVLRERLLLERLDHPLLVNLRFAFQDTDFLYLVVDLMLGGDLRFHISRKHFVESTVRFWIAEIACALRYLHRKGIAHRDIKPENAVLSYDGHVHLTDFNIATKVDPGNLLYTQCGTLEYQAPEMLAGCGYGTSVDWWSLGIMFYECIYGVRPFSRHNPEDVREAILYGAVRHPTSDNFTVSAECRDAINSLLERDLNKRIGCGRPNRGLRNNVMHLSDHLYFSGMDWARLQRKEVKPPFVPGATCDNFNPALDIEELLLEKNPLDIRSRTRVTLAKMGCYSEIQLIDDKFKDFDYLQTTNLFTATVSAFASATITSTTAAAAAAAAATT
ncbi:kinase C-like protein [Ramicandelaber brevisporus]|nr:kinase C-like protein [Ramicandelaber brevisporus]